MTCRRGGGAGRRDFDRTRSCRRAEIAASDFFVDYLTTALQPGEILTGVRVPKLGGDWGYRYEKFHRTAQAWAIVGVAALARRSNGHVAEARVGLTNTASVPVRAHAVEAAAAGADATREALSAAAASAADGTDPPADLHGAPDHRRHLARVLETAEGMVPARREPGTNGDGALIHRPGPKDLGLDVPLDVERVAPCMPVPPSTRSTATRFAACNIKVKVGPINMTYAGTAASSSGTRKPASSRSRLQAKRRGAQERRRRSGRCSKPR